MTHGLTFDLAGRESVVWVTRNPSYLLFLLLRRRVEVSTGACIFPLHYFCVCMADDTELEPTMSNGIIQFMVIRLSVEIVSADSVTVGVINCSTISEYGTATNSAGVSMGWSIGGGAVGFTTVYQSLNLLTGWWGVQKCVQPS